MGKESAILGLAYRLWSLVGRSSMYGLLWSEERRQALEKLRSQRCWKVQTLEVY
jgi:hypothetical protein